MLSYSVVHVQFLLDNPDFELATLVADGAVQTAVNPSWMTGKLRAVVVFDNSHSQCSDSFVI